ncbi:ABC transporter permease [filamentous cyanobacterium LEGE 11480]|uniref:Transport permease protein n=1 Tax=Romeriopsis navalis LEGE 11480 TaxID=2777977 RepID=A0A928VPF6_9CYAN|nr:ABC transporter permease [Romeriopsis navalis]MBE9029649.1 ABC transporter permease [Romeriopsis navalis LEGE 11480]
MTSQTLRKSTVNPNAFKNLIADSLTVFWGDWLDLRARILQVVSSGLISPLIYIVAFGLGLGSTLPRSSFSVGNSYLEFILPGMIALSSMVISFGGTTFSICGKRLFSKTFEELLLMPINPLAVQLGKMLAGIVRGLLTASSVILISIIVTRSFAFLHPLFLLVLILNCAVFAGLGVIVGLKVKSLESVGICNNFLIVPMSFLGGTFFDIEKLPIALKVICHFLPLTYTSMGLRAAAYQPLSQFPWYVIPVLLGFAAILAWQGSKQFSSLQD